MQIDTRNVVNFPDEYYVGTRENKKFDTDKPPLAFATPNGKDSAFQKRKATVDNWARPYNGRQKEGVIIKNEPQEGFYLKDWTSRWTTQNKWFNVIDPRGFHLQLSAAALSDLISDATIIKGVVQGKCVWGRRGTEHVLVPIDSEMYKQANAILDLPSVYSPGDYVFMQKTKCLYLGKFYKFELMIQNSSNKSYKWYLHGAHWFDSHYTQTKKCNIKLVVDKIYHMDNILEAAQKRYGNVEAEPTYTIPEAVHVYAIESKYIIFITRKSMAKAQNLGQSGIDITKLRQKYNEKPLIRVPPESMALILVDSNYSQGCAYNTLSGYKTFFMDEAELKEFQNNWETYKKTVPCRCNPIIKIIETKELKPTWQHENPKYEWLIEIDPNIT